MRANERPQGLTAQQVIDYHSTRDEATGCLLWRGAPNSSGYGSTSFGGKMYSAHRLAWIAAHGPIPAGYEVDHVCHNEAVAQGDCRPGRCSHRLCVEPSHLRVTTRLRNTLASRHPTECPSGHFRLINSGYCKECQRNSSRAWKEKNVGNAKVHGTVSSYTNYGCRCQPCKDAIAEAARERKAR